MKTTRQYGTWSSPVSAKSLSGSLRFYDVQWHTAGETLIWVERHGKNSLLMAQTGIDAPRQLTPHAVGGRVGYGGGEFTTHDDVVFFVGPEGRVYRLPLFGGEAQAITPAFGGSADPTVSPDGRWLVFAHTYEGCDGLAIVDTQGELWARKLAFGTDFVLQPTWSPDGSQIAYIAWNHPNMPWDQTELRLITLGFDSAPYAENITTLRDGASIIEPRFSPDGRYLAYISNETDFTQIYVYDLQDKIHRAITGVESGAESESVYLQGVDVPPEHGKPAWVQGGRTYAWHGNNRIVFLRNQEGVSSVWQADLDANHTEHLDVLTEYTFHDQLSLAPDGSIAVITASSRISDRIVSHKDDTTRIHARSTLENIPTESLSEAQTVRWTGDDGEDIYGLYYPPTSDRFEGSGKPPLIVEIHGGPTAQQRAGYDGRTQFFATRGFAVLHVNYRGSTGYGRAYKDKLRGQWGVYDVEDAASGATYLVEQGLADPDKLVILGSSAGGYTVLQSLVEKPGFYAAGVCLYGISNQFLLVQDTHKFESRYNDGLIGALPEASDVYRERSPFFNAQNMVDPVIIFQGADDVVVPQNQSDAIVGSLRSRGVPHEYHVYEGEGHGFRKPETLEHFYNAVMNFLTQYVIYR